jgi:hypothetical protein
MKEASTGLKNDIERRTVLADWAGKVVRVQGRLVKYSSNKNPTHIFLVALIDDIEVTLPNRERHDLGHGWMQHVETMKDIVPEYARFSCDCKVRMYMHNNQECWGLTYPHNVKKLEEPVALMSTPPPPPPTASPPPRPDPPANPLTAILKLKAELDELGGADKILALCAAVEEAGGWERALRVKALVDAVDGLNNLRQLLGLLR